MALVDFLRAQGGPQSGARAGKTTSEGWNVSGLAPFQLIGASLAETAGLHLRMEASSRYSAQIVGTALAGPKPAKGARGQAGPMVYFLARWMLL